MTTGISPIERTKILSLDHDNTSRFVKTTSLSSPFRKGNFEIKNNLNIEYDINRSKSPRLKSLSLSPRKRSVESPSYKLKTACSEEDRNVDKLNRLVNRNRKTDIMPEPFEEFDRLFSSSSLLKSIRRSSTSSSCGTTDLNFDQQISVQNMFSSEIETLQLQLNLFRLQIAAKIKKDSVMHDKDILKAWRLVYDAEEHEFNLLCEERIASDVFNMHEKLISMNNIINSVLEDLRPTIACIESYGELNNALQQSNQSAKTVKRINETLVSNNNFAASLVELERSVRTIKLLAEHSTKSTSTSVKCPQQKRPIK